MSHLGWDALRREWSVSCAILSEILGERIRTASVADGYYSRKVGQAAAASGLEVLFNSEPTTAISVVDDCLILGRYSIKAGMPGIASGAIAAGRIWPRWRQAALWEAKKTAKRLAGESYFSIRKLVLARAPPR